MGGSFQDEKTRADFGRAAAISARRVYPLATEPALIPLLPLAAQSPEAARLFPGHAPGAELAVVSDEGAVWLGDHAWIMCLYALRNYRDWAKEAVASATAAAVDASLDDLAVDGRAGVGRSAQRVPEPACSSRDESEGPDERNA